MEQNEQDEIFVDLDGTLARAGVLFNVLEIGEPVPAMVERVRAMLARGESVVIFTARLGESEKYNPGRVSDEKIIETIKEWCLLHVGQELRVTNVKGNIKVGYDDRFRQVIKNTGLTLVEHLDLIIENMLFEVDSKDNKLDAWGAVVEVNRRINKLLAEG